MGKAYLERTHRGNNGVSLNYLVCVAKLLAMCSGKSELHTNNHTSSLLCLSEFRVGTHTMSAERLSQLGCVWHYSSQSLHHLSTPVLHLRIF